MNRHTVIVDAIRTPIGRKSGSLSSVRADHLTGYLLNAIVDRNNIKPNVVDDVIMGCVTQVGEQCGNIARTSLLSAGWPEGIPGLTVDRKCGSGEAAIHVASALISSGTCDVIVAGGAESMSRVPIGGNRDVHGNLYGWQISDRYELIPQGESAERIAEKWDISRTELDEFSVHSHKRAFKAQEQGIFKREIVAVPVHELSEDRQMSHTVFETDETIRPDSSVEKMGTLKTSFRTEHGKISAGNSSQISDGASTLLLMSEDYANANGYKIRARIKATANVGSDPTLMLTGPITSTQKVLRKAGLSIQDIDIFEVNEAFASVPMAWMKEMNVPHEKLNVNGGAIALGHPLGATGARLMTSMLHEMERQNLKFGLQAICCGGGMATASIIERV